MGIEHLTAWPSKYAAVELAPEDDPIDSPPPTGKVLLRLEAQSYFPKRYMAEKISRALHKRGRYCREHNSFSWENMTLCCNTLSCGPVPITDLHRFEPAFEALKGYTPADITVTYFSEQRDIRLLANLINIIESRAALIQQALALEDLPQVILNDGFALGISLSAFSYPKIEAVAYLMAQACDFAASTGKARMKPADGSNPKFQMRSWLLRLGFIGPAFERPRKTLLETLDGDSAFFSEDQKKTQIARRRVRSMNTYA